MTSKNIKILFLIAVVSILHANIFASVEDQHVIEKLKKDLPTLTNDTSIALQLINISFYYNMVDYDSAIFYNERAYELANKMNFKLGIAHSHFVKGIIHYQAENFEESLKDNLQATELYTELEDTRNIGATYTNMGIIYALGIDKQTAIEYYIKSLEISQQLNDSLGVAINLNNIGIMYQELKNYELAADYFKRTLEIDLALGNNEDIAHSYNNLGELYLDYKKFDLAYTNLITSHKLIGDVNDPDLQIEIFACLGEYYLETNNPDSALAFIDKALIAAQKYGRRKNQAYNYYLSGRYLLLIEKYKPAIFHITEAIKLSDSIGVAEHTAEYYEYISKAYLKIQDFKNAHLNLKKSNEVKDAIHVEEVTKSLGNFEKQAELLRIQTEFQLEQQIKNSEFEKKALRLQLLAQSSIIVILLLVSLVVIFIIYYRNKTKANNLLKKQNEIIEQQSEELKISVDHLEEREKELERSNITKDKFFSIIAHDLKNPFNIILGYADILNTEYEDFDEPERKRMITEIDKSSKVTYNLLDNLLTWSRSQQGKIQINKELYNLKFLVDQSCEPYKLNASNKNIKISTEIPVNYKICVDKFTMSTAIGNLLSNAIKFTPNGGLIAIYAESDHKNIKLSFKDTGIGMNEETALKLFEDGKSSSTLGTNNESGTGLGLMLCQEFVKKNDGEISVVSKIGKGSIFTFTFPIPKTDE